MSGAHAIGVDLCGTKIAAGVVDEQGKILAREELKSDITDFDGVRGQIGELVRALGAEGVSGLGIGAAGIVDHKTGHYLYGPNTGLRDVDMAASVSDEVHLPVWLDNDANCAAWAEHRFGCGVGTQHFLCVTLGTGIGGGLVIGGKPYRGTHGGAAEIGHMLVDPNGPLCGCGQRGCWEQFASGLALERTAREEMNQHPGTVLHEAPDGRVHGKSVTDAARNGDEFAIELVERMARWIGWGFASLANILEPERIAVAGGVVRDWDVFEKVALDAMRDRIEASDRRPLPDVKPAALGPDAGIVGAALLVFEEV
jgi:glucokinase